MDHDDGTESEGNAPQNEIANDESLRGNSTEKSVAEENVEDGDEAKSMDNDNNREMMDVDDASGAEGGNMDVSSVDDGEDEASGVSDVEPPTGNTTHASLLSNDTPDGNEEVGASEAEQQQQQSDAANDDDMKTDDDEADDQPPNGEPSTDVGNEGEPTHNNSEAIQAPPSSGEPIESTTLLQQPSDQLDTSLSVEQSSAQPGPDMSMEEDDTDVKSDKANTTTGVTSEGGDTTAAVKSPPAVSPGPDSKRKPLEDAYGPYIHLDDTCLEDARERLHSAIEQTRLLREALTEQAYERYRCVVKPAPDTLDEIIDPIRDDPIKARQDLAKKAEEIKVEKELERTQAEKAGVVPEELAYFGEGLHLVILPEDEVDEDEIDLSELPTRGPIDPETGEIVEDLKNAYANATEQVFERIRRIRAIRMGGDINEVGKQQEAMKRMKLGGGGGGGGQQSINEPVNSNSAGYAAGYAAAQAAAAAATKTRAAAVAPKPSSSPAPSFASDDSDMYQKGASQHLLTLAPNAEGIRPDGSFTAVQSALVARGVGMHETQHDLRINPKYQRMIQPNYFSPTASQQLLPPLLRPHDLYRLQAADARRKGVESGLASAKTSIKSVVEDIISKDGTGKTDNGINGNIQKSLEEERSAMEIGLMRRMRTASGASEGASAPSVAAKKTIELLKSDQTTNGNTDNADPSLAFSVMNAVGILRKKEDEGNGDKKESSEIAETGIVKALGLDGSLSGLESVSKFLGNGVKTTDTTTTKSKPDSSSVDNGGKQEEEEVAQIRGGGGQDESNTEETKSQKSDDPLLDYRAGLNAVYGSSDPYHTASLTAQHQLNMPLSHLPLQASNMSDLYLQNSLASVAALRQANPNARADILAQHPQLSASLGLIPGQTQHDMMLWEHHNAAATAAAAAQYQAALAQNPLGGYSASSLDQSIAALQMQRELLNRKRSFSMSESKTNDAIDLVGDSNKAPEIARAASAPPSPLNFEKKSSSRKSSKKIMSQESFDIPSPPQGVSQDIADLITHAKFHKAHSLYKGKEEDSEALLIQFLLTLSAAVPISKDFIADALTKKLKSSHYKLRLHEFVGNSTSACASRDVIIAIISIWLWAEHKDCLALDENESEASFRWLIDLAIDKSLSALASFFALFGLAKDTPNEQVASIASKSLADQVCVDHRADASFPMMEDLLVLLVNLRTEALQAKTQERVLLAALASRCGSMSEAFSNAYVSAIVRAGVALGHENVCEMGQDEGSRASTMLPYDYFHDAFGVWEEPCRPTTGFHSAIGSDELKKRAHARSVIQKSMKKLQSRLGLQGGILDGGPYFPIQSKNKSKQPTMAAAPPIQRSASGSLKRRASYDDGAGQESNFNPEHYIAPMMWNPTGISNLPYGQYEGAIPGATGLPYGQYEGAIPGATGKKKKRKLDSSQGDVVALSSAAQHCSSQEYEWEDVANMFFQGAAVDYDFGSNVQLGKKKIYAPYVNDFDRSTLKTLSAEDEGGSSPDEDISDETMLQRHQQVLDDMKIKLDAALESRKHHLQSEKKVDGRKDNGRKKKQV